MLKSIEIKGYRCFEQYRVEGLSRVNLLVGKNNCGKTALLEAVWLAVTEGDPRVLLDIAERRGEIEGYDHLIRSEEYDLPFRSSGTFVDHFFYGHTINIGSSLSLESENEQRAYNTLSLEIHDSGDVVSPEDTKQGTLFEKSDDTGDFSLIIRNSKGSFLATPLVLQLADRAVLFRRYRRQVWQITNGKNPPSVQFIAPELARTDLLRFKWDKVLSDGREADVVESLKILAPEVRGIHFLSNRNRRSSSSSDSVIVVFESGERIPLGSLGDGMRYLLGLAIAMVFAAGGVILIDEIDTGLHYSVMGDLWRLVVETAKQRDIQVFATTHSQDCVRGLAWLCDNYPDLKQDISLQKIDADLEESVDVDGDGIVLAVDQRIEVR